MEPVEPWLPQLPVSDPTGGFGSEKLAVLAACTMTSTSRRVMVGHRCRIVPEHTFHSGPPASLVRQQQSHCGTHCGQLALSGLGLLPPFLSNTETATPAPPVLSLPPSPQQSPSPAAPPISAPWACVPPTPSPVPDYGLHGVLCVTICGISVMRDAVAAAMGKSAAVVVRNLFQPILDVVYIQANTVAKGTLNSDKANGKGKVRVECAATVHFMRTRLRKALITMCLEEGGMNINRVGVRLWGDVCREWWDNLPRCACMHGKQDGCPGGAWEGYVNVVYEWAKPT